MANSIDDFLSKSSQEQKDKFQALVTDVTKDTKDTIKLQEADKNPTADLKQTKEATPQNVKEAQQTAEKNDPTIGNEQTPQQAQSAQNAVDRALDNKAKAQVAEIGQTLSKEGVTTPQPKQDQEKDR